MQLPGSQFLLFGHDTVEVAYYLSTAGCGIDFESLAVQREDLRLAKKRDGQAVTLGGTEFLLMPFGTRSGYPFSLVCPDYSIRFGPNNSPSFHLTFPSVALWRKGPEALHQQFMAWALGLGLVPIRHETLSRVDFSFDYHVPAVDFDWQHFVSQAQKSAIYRDGGAAQTFAFGKGDVVVRVYDKIAEIHEASGKTWFFPLWGCEDRVWRIEWQVRGEVLRRFGIRSFADLFDQQGDVLTWLATDHTTLRIPAGDSNRSRWPLHPLWVDLQKQIARLPRQGLTADIDPEALIEERLMRCAISVYGYLKNVGALQSVRRHQPVPIAFDDALASLDALLHRVHDSLTWKVDVAQRMDDLRLRL